MVLTVDNLIEQLKNTNNSNNDWEYFTTKSTKSTKSSKSSLDYNCLNLTTSGKMVVNVSYGSSSNCMYSGHYCSESVW